MQSDHDEQKQTLFTKVFDKNKSVGSTDDETGLSDAASPEISIKNTDKGSKAEKRKFQDVLKSKFSWLGYYSSKVLWFLQKGRPIYLRLYYFKIFSKKTLTLLIIFCFFNYKF